jgi:tRNA(adenine34) deaminase
VGKLTVGSNPTASAMGNTGGQPGSPAPTGSPDGAVPGDGAAEDVAMGLALAEAERALEHGDVPVGAVALVGERVVASRHNERELTGDPTAHAEILALADAAAALGTWRLSDVTLVVTLEPCPMCAGALVAARLGRVVYGAADPKAGACGSTTCAPIPGSTTKCRSPPACGPTRQPGC